VKIPSLPKEFLSRMKEVLGEEYEAFINTYNHSVSIGIRFNTLKITPEEYKTLLPINLETIPWCPTGFLVPPSTDQNSLASFLSQHPYRAAGLYYLQDPSAMAVAELIYPRPGDKILDLAAAPGGKTTHIAALMNNNGLLVANDIHRRRAWELVKNLERFGIRNVTVTNETTERLAGHFGRYFDKVLVDAPCSGEGMFRKHPRARLEWSVNQIKGCAKRQLHILKNASRLVKSGGTITYATCTFSPEENEIVIAKFLDKHNDFILVKPQNLPGSSEGITDRQFTYARYDLRNTIRYWPHKCSCEGHFMAILQCISNEVSNNLVPWKTTKLPSDLDRLFTSFCFQNLLNQDLKDNLALCNHNLYRLQTGLPDLKDLRVIRPGWHLGKFKKNRFEPSHALAMGLCRNDVQRVLWTSTHKSSNQIPTVAQCYLYGESLEVDQIRFEYHENGKDNFEGWVLVTLDGFPLGWGKRVGDVIKNYYPRGLRRLYKR
jgi:NOL1/NOP2/sun family putative RNA methylase